MRDLVPCERCRRHILAGASCPFCARRAASVSMGPQAAPNPAALRAASVSMGPQAAPNPAALRAASLAVIVAASVAAASCGPENQPTPEVPTDPKTGATADSATTAPAEVATASPSVEPTASPSVEPTASADPAPTSSVAPQPTGPATVPTRPRPQPKYGISRPPKPMYGMTP